MMNEYKNNTVVSQNDATKNQSKSELFKYLIVGGATTFVGYSSFWLLNSKIALNYNIANLISIILAILFAFFANKYLVFSNFNNSPVVIFKELLLFFASRAFAAFTEFIGVYVMVAIINIKPMIAKISIAFIVVILNFFFTRFIFKNKH